MDTRDVVVAVFIDKKNRIAVQERGKHSKGVGEYFGFWGGKIEEDEIKEEAIKRELKEELGYSPNKLEYWDVFSYIYKEKGVYTGWKINQHVFLSPITKTLLKADIKEGASIIIMNLKDVIQGKGFPSGSTKFLKSLKRKLIEVPDIVN